MSEAAEATELDAAIAAAGLSNYEAAQVRALVADGGNETAAIDFVLRDRDEPDPDEEEPPTPAPPDGEPTERQLHRLDNELTRHERRVREIMGDHVAGFVTCETCGGAGLTPPGAPPPEVQTHTWFKACPTCAGYGQVLTGSIRDGNQLRDCPECGGRGYLEALDTNGAALAAGGSAPSAPAAIPASIEPPQVAQAPSGEITFGRPQWMGDPNLGA